MSEARLLRELNPDRVWATIEEIVHQFPSRLAGSESAWNAAGFMHERMRAESVPAELMEYPGLVSFPGEAYIEILSPERRVVPATVLGHSASTGSGYIEAELVDVGIGNWERCEEVGIAGKITLSELSYSPPRQEKQRVMSLQGARAAIMLNWGYDDSTPLPYGSVKPCWGNPTRLTARTEMPTIPCLGVSRADGLALRALCEKGPVRLRIRAECTDEWRNLRQAIGRVPGRGRSREFAIVGGHMDAWYGQSASDNAAGNACLLELARVFQRFAGEFERDLMVGLWVGHETGTMIGSSVFVDTYWDELRENAVGYLQIDQPGLRGTTVWETRSDAELRDFHTEVEHAILGEAPLSWRRLVKVGDTSFFGVGVPSMSSRGGYTDEEIRAMGVADLGWWHHTDESTLEKLDKELYQKHLEVYASYLWGFVTSPIVPSRFTPSMRQIVDRLGELVPQGGSFDLASTASIANEAFEAVTSLDSVADNWRSQADKGSLPEDVKLELNSGLKRMSRILLPLTGTAIGTYGHDPYGLAAQTTVLPGLYDLARWNRLPAASEERYMLTTELIRQRNRLTDGMREARDLAKQTLAAVQS